MILILVILMMFCLKISIRQVTSGKTVTVSSSGWSQCDVLVQRYFVCRINHLKNRDTRHVCNPTLTNIYQDKRNCSTILPLTCTQSWRAWLRKTPWGCDTSIFSSHRWFLRKCWTPVCQTPLLRVKCWSVIIMIPLVHTSLIKID